MKKLAAIAAASTLCVATAYAGHVASMTDGSKSTTNGQTANSSSLNQKVIPHHSTAQVMTKSTKHDGSKSKASSGKCGH